MLSLRRLHPFIACLLICRATVYDFEKLGGKPDDDSSQTAWANGGLVNKTLQAILQPGDTLFFPNKTFTLMGGVQAEGLRDVTIQIDGTLEFKDDIDSWPTQDGKVLNCMVFKNVMNMTFTSSGKGTIDGKGERWWGIPGIGYLIQGKNRPNLFEIDTGKDVLIENLLFKQSPCLTVWAHNMDGLEIRWTDIDARRTDADSHTIIDLTAFNTDGFDVAGKNVWIHDCNVWNQDDCVCVKGNSENMLFERINASGLGLVIGSISGSTVNNITFRDCYMHHTFKGIYTKFRAGEKPGLISNVLFENIVIDAPEQWGIWIGPAQQSDSNDLCAAHPCSLCWPMLPFSKCDMPVSGSYENITLRNISILNPGKSPGVLLGNSKNPMRNVLFDNVKVLNPKKKPWRHDYYKCVGVNGVATGGTWPVPECFKDMNEVDPESLIG
ncbi:hypothetical protein AAMO2058_000923900 [Amorphochlora amoebiformis]